MYQCFLQYQKRIADDVMSCGDLSPLYLPPKKTAEEKRVACLLPATSKQNKYHKVAPNLGMFGA